MTGPWDGGLQPERTELAWRRTSLSLAVGSLVAARLLPAEFGSWLWAAPGVIGVVVSALLWLTARTRYRATSAALHRRAPGETPGARMILVTAIFTTLAGLGGAALVLVRA